MICISFEHENEKYICMNVYYPNDPRAKCDFHQEVKQAMEHYDAQTNIILAGDFNCIANRELDNVCGQSHSQREIDSFKIMCEHLQLYDTWRMFNGEDKDYTWKHKIRPIMRRIDYIFCNNKFLEKIVI